MMSSDKPSFWYKPILNQCVIGYFHHENNYFFVEFQFIVNFEYYFCTNMK